MEAVIAINEIFFVVCNHFGFIPQIVCGRDAWGNMSRCGFCACTRRGFVSSPVEFLD